jgi:hypothetical protein
MSISKRREHEVRRRADAVAKDNERLKRRCWKLERLLNALLAEKKAAAEESSAPDHIADANKMVRCGEDAKPEDCHPECPHRGECNRLREDLETERLRLAACGVVALSDTPESAEKARQMHASYRSASCDDVARRVDECMRLRLIVGDIKRHVEGHDDGPLGFLARRIADLEALNPATAGEG